MSNTTEVLSLAEIVFRKIKIKPFLSHRPTETGSFSILDTPILSPRLGSKFLRNHIKIPNELLFSIEYSNVVFCVVFCRFLQYGFQVLQQYRCHPRKILNETQCFSRFADIYFIILFHLISLPKFLGSFGRMESAQFNFQSHFVTHLNTNKPVFDECRVVCPVNIVMLRNE